MAKKKTRLQRSTEILNKSVATKWCYVNTENEFSFMGKVFVISDTVTQYRVINKAGEVEDYTNESFMEEIMVAVDQDNQLRFYDQDYYEIEKENISVCERRIEL